ncbi:MAG TPA: hypothetical protein DEP46_04445 [Blastocatellia bacterium]|nr:hypothetical protein [Blastocatellia bacterium]
MKRWAIGSIAFFAALSLGAVITIGVIKASGLIAYADRFDPRILQAIEVPELRPASTSFDVPPIFDPTVNYPKTLPVKLLFPGAFHSDEVPYRSGERWLGLFREQGNTTLKWTTIDVKPIREPDLMDTEVSVRDSKTAIFLLRGESRLKPGKIDTMFDAEDHPEFTIDDCSDPRSSFRIRGSFWRLCIENSYGNGFPSKDSSLLLKAPGSDPVVLTAVPNGCNDCSWKLLWVGDLDRDSRPDFLIDVSSHYNSYEPTLFLSSKNYAVFASFRGVGC